MKAIGNSDRIYAPYTVGNAPTNNVAYTDLANAFTLAQAISLSTAGTAFSITSTEAGSGTGPDIDLYRDSASPADNDFLGRIHFYGESDTGTKREYGRIYSKIIDASDATEDGAVGISTMRAGTLTDWSFISGAFYYASTLTSPTTAGAINATQYQVNNATISPVLQTVGGITQLSSSISSVIPSDNTKPQIGEGGLIMALADFTPRSSSSTLHILATICVAGSTGLDLNAALFDGSADAIATASTEGLSSSCLTMTLSTFISSGSTSARTYSIRVGPGSAGTMYVNRGVSGDLFGGTLTSSLCATEYL